MLLPSSSSSSLPSTQSHTLRLLIPQSVKSATKFVIVIQWHGLRCHSLCLLHHFRHYHRCFLRHFYRHHNHRFYYLKLKSTVSTTVLRNRRRSTANTAGSTLTTSIFVYVFAVSASLFPSLPSSSPPISFSLKYHLSLVFCSLSFKMP